MPGRYQSYPEYKTTDEVWLGSVPKHWRALKINRLTQIKRGASPRPIEDPKYFDENGEYAWVRIADVSASDTYLENSTQQLSALGASLSVKLEPNELFLSVAGTVGKPCINKIKACIHDGFVYFPELKENSKFIYYIFAAGEAYKGLGKFGTQLNLNTETVGGIKIGIPKIEEQNKIVHFLDNETEKIDTLIAKQKKLIELLKEKRQAVISHAVTRGLNPNAQMKKSGVEWLGEVPENWVVKQLKHCFTLQRGHDLASSQFKKGKYPVYGSNGVIGHHAEFTTYAPCITVGRSGSVGEVNFINENFWAHNTSLYLKSYNNSDVKYIYYFLLSMDLKSLAAGSAVGSLDRNNIHCRNIAVPCIEEQKEISIYLEKQLAKFDLMKQKSLIGISLLKERKTALISAAVTGKIDVRNWQEQ
ncbi:restriction endonuclease subunit S [Colwellia sp. 75C3]|uniref:restriction endonuclease subunit S n=1 Tax=Colwellia sp. 75C3 TaxID=888425 RepID=UPI000C3454DB|nr:restriction endonuclease subunit S [Colwellia sp. 75C3]PKG86297.1 restriction endonuclease subunit S [Colwellia sp. 75C3]